MTPESHRIKQLWSTLPRKDKEILQRLYNPPAGVDWRKARIHAPGVVNLSIYLHEATAQKHLRLLEARGFLREVGGLPPIRFGPVEDPLVRQVILAEIKPEPIQFGG